MINYVKGSLKLFCVLLALIVVSGATPLWAQYDSDTSALIIIDPTGPQKIRIAIADLEPINPGGKIDSNATALPRRLADNLSMTGLFQDVNAKAAIESNKRSGIDAGVPIDYAAWTPIRVDYLVKGGMSVSGSKLTLEMRLFDVVNRSQILAKRYHGSVKDARKMINQFTNAVILAITGKPGVFGSDIIFVSGSMSNKSIMMTEFGSDEAKTLAGSRGGPSTQPTIGPGGKTAWVHRNGKKWELLVDGKVVSSGTTHLSPAFKADGTVVAAYSDQNSTNIYSFAGRSKTPLVSQSGINVSPTFSPDGSRMAYVSNGQIYIGSASGGGGLGITSGGKNTDPAWSPTGEYIAFVTRETDICIIRPDGTGLRQLTQGQGVNKRPSFSPDGRMILFSSNRNGRSQLFTMSIDGDMQQPIMPGYSGDQQSPFWSPVMPD